MWYRLGALRFYGLPGVSTSLYLVCTSGRCIKMTKHYVSWLMAQGTLVMERSVYFGRT